MKTIAALSIAFIAFSGASAFAADSAAGKTSYDKSCKACHGATGVANPAIVKMMGVPINDLGSAAVQGQSDADLAKIITGGKGKMKPISSLSGSPDDVVAYIRTLKK
jgi:mono/diheme cytochrome c family protein